MIKIPRKLKKTLMNFNYYVDINPNVLCTRRVLYKGKRKTKYYEHAKKILIEQEKERFLDKCISVFKETCWFKHEVPNHKLLDDTEIELK